jgi:hypothetical protein
VTIRCSDIYGNASGDWTDCIEGDLGQAGNISEDPLFCDSYGNVCLIESDSPCAPEHNPACGLIGACWVDCSPPATGACCLADGSCSVLEGQQCVDEHGTYKGDGTTCTPNPCQPTPTRATTWGRIRAGFR